MHLYMSVFWSKHCNIASLFSLVRHMKLYSEAAAASNITVTEHKVTYDPDASWLKFHLGINRYALYSRDDPAIPKLLREMKSMTVVSAGEGGTGEVHVRLCQSVCAAK